MVKAFIETDRMFLISMAYSLTNMPRNVTNNIGLATIMLTTK
ncbi:unnamed protein product [marine sediment metagenome]|uniref:Uncharacterized protein n=1 Tax=marine sediment metagenome TaxID=412755 RepID=X0TLX4_9ZZZZ